METRRVGPATADPYSHDSYRRSQAQGLRTILRGTNLAEVQPVCGPELVGPLFEPDHRFITKYGQLGEELYTGFARAAYTTGDSRLFELASAKNILNGCYVLTSILSYGPKAYARYLEEHPGKSGSVTELADIMRRSKGVIKFFADKDKKSNITHETNFGLLGAEPVYEELPFVIEQDEDGNLEFRTSPFTEKRSRIDVAGRIASGEISRDQLDNIHCPALGMVLNAFWDQAIDRCVEDPALFAADLPMMA